MNSAALAGRRQAFRTQADVDTLDGDGEAPRRARVRRGRDVTRTAEGPGHAQLASLAVRKSHDLVLMRMPSSTNGSPEARVSLVQRRAVNVLLSIAQTADRDNPSNDGYYSVDLVEFERLLGFADAGNRKYWIALVREICGLKFEFLGVNQIHFGSVVAEIEICFVTKVLKFSLPVGMKAKLLRPERYLYLRLMLLNLFTSYPSLVLFELITGFMGHPAHRTPAYTWQEFSKWLTGSNVAHRTYREFSKLLGRAIAQVNDICPSHSIELNYVREGRATGKIWFAIREKRQAALPLVHTPKAISSAVAAALRSFSLKSADIELLLMQHDEEYLLAQAQLVTRRMEKSAAGSVSHPRAYFLKAVSENWAECPRECSPIVERSSAAQAAQTDLALGGDARQRWWEARSAGFRAQIAAASAAELEVLCRKVDAPLSKLSLYGLFKKHGLTRPLIIAAAALALARQEYREPTEAELLVG